MIPRKDELIGSGAATENDGEAEAVTEGVGEGAALVGPDDVGRAAPA